MTARKQARSDEAVQTALAALKRAYDNAAAAINATPVPQDAFESATELANVLRELAEAAADLRAHSVARIWEAEELSLAALAQRIGVSKARADQLLRSTKSLEGETVTAGHHQRNAPRKTTPTKARGEGVNNNG